MRKIVNVARLAMGILIVLTLASCFRPMYAQSDVNEGSGIREALASVSIEASGDRVGQQITNNLSFRLTGGNEAPVAKYRLSVAAHSLSGTALVDGLNSTPTIDTATFACDFTLVDIESNKILLKAQVFARKSYNFSFQRYANIRGQRGAENAVARELADQIQIRLATFFASHHVSTTG
ncbi:LPS assembly lipoprotein LptE [Labrys sp. 22185]|uniref:LPS assembly lipoprotein LptE n=1 Tax=Labrys sp. 22185 TaxID=3453888 RepID=UPI003F835363